MFKLGWKGGPGRPKGSKNTLPIIRDKLCRILLRRITRNKDLDSVSTDTLIKFVSSVLPKDMSLSLNRPTQVNYISNVPRATELESKINGVVVGEVAEEENEEDGATN